MGFVIRGVPEVLAGPYTLGFDTVVSYLPAMVTRSYLRLPLSSLFGSASLLYVVATLLFLALGDPIMALKVLAPLLYGLVGMAVFVYARAVLKWDAKLSFLAVLLASVSLGGLRISWDMHRNSLGLVFLFFTLTALQSRRERVKLLAAPLAFLNVWAYEVTAVYMILILGLILFYGMFRRMFHDALYVLLVLVASVPLLLFQQIHSSGALAVPVRAIFPLSSATVVGEALYFLLFLHFPLLPLAVYGFRRLEDPALNLWGSISLLLAVPLPLLGVESLPHYRLAFMLSYPLAFCAAAAVRALKQNGGSNSLNARVAFVLAFIPILVGALYLVSSPLSPYLYTGLEPRFYRYMPTGMLQNTVPVERTGDLVEALQWLDRNAADESVIVLPAQFYGWALITMSRLSIVMNVGEISPFNPYGTSSLLNQTVHALQNGASEVYTLWWSPGINWYDVESLPNGFVVIERFEDFAVYAYVGQA